MNRTTFRFVKLFIIIEIVLFTVGLIYVYIAGSCVPGSPSPNLSDIRLKGFILPIILAILAPILYLLICKKKKK
jgi:hypothetical protein